MDATPKYACVYEALVLSFSSVHLTYDVAFFKKRKKNDVAFFLFAGLRHVRHVRQQNISIIKGVMLLLCSYFCTVEFKFWTLQIL